MKIRYCFLYLFSNAQRCIKFGKSILFCFRTQLMQFNQPLKSRGIIRHRDNACKN